MNERLNLMCSNCRSRTQHDRRAAAAEGPESVYGLYSCIGCGRLQVLRGSQFDAGGDANVVFPTNELVRDGIPESVLYELDQAAVAMAGGAWSLAVTGYRAALQAAVTEAGGTGDALQKQIRSLAESLAIPATLAAWADQVRLAGNATAHPDVSNTRPTYHDAEEIQALTASLLEYLFLVPARVEVRKSRLAAQAMN